ncbi:MAG: DUF128 domain-containing protein [Candidatus Brockarchaeota archaeon]|nr:DUF128 domain-containing protein [Candidatus Brockarchaeota archaeon]MBO3808765.1 DUF128 domain-containing protein [Candidatus Brockarchaeota archaeon]
MDKSKVAPLTVCNLTVDGILIRSGIPLILKYAGILQFVNRRPATRVLKQPQPAL